MHDANPRCLAHLAEHVDDAHWQLRDGQLDHSNAHARLCDGRAERIQLPIIASANQRSKALRHRVHEVVDWLEARRADLQLQLAVELRRSHAMVVAELHGQELQSSSALFMNDAHHCPTLGGARVPTAPMSWRFRMSYGSLFVPLLLQATPCIQPVSDRLNTTLMNSFVLTCGIADRNVEAFAGFLSFLGDRRKRLTGLSAYYQT